MTWLHKGQRYLARPITFKGGVSEGRPKVISLLKATMAIRSGCGSFLLDVQAQSQEMDGIDERARAVVEEYDEVFQPLPPGLPTDRGGPFKIDTGNSAPVFSRGYRLTPKEKEQVEAQLLEYLDKELIRPSNSPYGSAILFVQKRDGSLRMCVDYRGLNKTTVKDRGPLPLIDDLVDKLHGAKVFSSLDLQSGYHQIRITNEDVHKKAFITHKGLFEYRVMPFGLCNAPSVFQRQMDKMLGHLPFVVVYLDDILVFSRDEEEHRRHLRTVLSL